MSSTTTTTTVTPATTATTTLDTDVKIGETALAGLIGAIMAMDPATAAAGAILLAVCAAVPGGIAAVEAIIASLKNNATSTAPVLPQIEADVAKTEADLDAALGGSST